MIEHKARVGKTMPRRLPVKLSDLEDALENASYEHIYVLDVETGEVLWTTADESRELEDILEDIYEEFEGAQGDELAALEAELERRDLPAWRKEALLQAARFDAGFGTRYRRIERDDPHADYRDMEAFIDTVGNAQLQSRLERAISGRGAFRYFKDVLLDHPRERERWFEFRSARLRQRALEWLREEDIEPVAE